MRPLLLLICFLPFVISAQPPTPETVVQAQLDAYNAQDIYTFKDLFHENALLYMNIGDESPSIVGRESVGEFYGNLFESFPDNQAVLLSRTVQGNFVFDHEHITGRRVPVDVMSIYEVVDGLIVRCWFAR